MIGNLNANLYVDAWRQAKYVLEVFAAMLDSEDTLKLYVLSDYQDNGSMKPRHNPAWKRIPSEPRK